MLLANVFIIVSVCCPLIAMIVDQNIDGAGIALFVFWTVMNIGAFIICNVPFIMVNEQRLLIIDVLHKKFNEKSTTDSDYGQVRNKKVQALSEVNLLR